MPANAQDIYLSSDSKYFNEVLLRKWKLKDAIKSFEKRYGSNAENVLKNVLEKLSNNTLNMTKSKRAKKLLEELERRSNDITTSGSSTSNANDNNKNINDNNNCSSSTSQKLNIYSGHSNPDIKQNNITLDSRDKEQQIVPINQKRNNDHMEEWVNEENERSSSSDHMPRRKKLGHLGNHYDSNDNRLSQCVNMNDKWQLGEINLSEYLFDYRQESRDLIVTQTQRELIPARILSLGNIFLFSRKRHNSCIRDLPNSLIDLIYTEVLPSDNCLSEVPPISTWVDQLTSMDFYDSKDEARMTKILGQMLVDAASAKENVEVAIKSANVVSDLAKLFTRAGAQTDMYEEKRGAFGEDTFIHQVVAPWLRNIFYGPLLGTNWANSQLAAYAGISPSSSSSSSSLSAAMAAGSLSSSTNLMCFDMVPNNDKESKLLPDFTVYAFVRSIRFDLLAVEIRPPCSGKGDDDRRKVATEMHLMLNKLVDSRIERPVVCGIAVDGFKCSTYILDLKYDGIYRLVELSSLELPSSINDLSKAKQCLAAFLQIKNIIDATTANIEKCLKANRSTLHEPS